MNLFFGKILKEVRKEKGFTQAELADIFHVSKTTICQWETSKQEPSLNDVVEICRYFGITSDYMLGLEDEVGNKVNVNNSFNNNSGNINFKT